MIKYHPNYHTDLSI